MLEVIRGRAAPRSSSDKERSGSVCRILGKIEGLGSRMGPVDGIEEPW